MQDFLQFVIKHWFLWLFFLITLVLFVLEELRHQTGGSRKLSPQMMVHLMNKENGKVIDLREADVFNTSHILHSQNIPAKELEQHLKKIEKLKSKPIILICPQGNLSPKISSLMQKQGFEKVYYLNGGLKAWKTAGFPITHKS